MLRIVGKMDDEEEEVLSCAGMFWIDAAKKMALACCPRDEDSLPRSEGNEMVGDGTVLKREDMVVHGLCPSRDEFFLVVCEQCQMLVKPQALAYHIDLRHRLGIGESHSAFLSSTPSLVPATTAPEKAIPRKRPTDQKPSESTIADAVIKSTMCRRRRSRRAKVKSRSRMIATQGQQFLGVDATSCRTLPVHLDLTSISTTPGSTTLGSATSRSTTLGSATSVFLPQKFGGVANDLSNQRPFVGERRVTESRSVEVLSESGRAEPIDSRSSGRGIIIRFAQLNRGKGTWIAEMGGRCGRPEPEERSPVVQKDGTSSRVDDLKPLSFVRVQSGGRNTSISKSSVDLSSMPSDHCSQLTDVSATERLKRHRPLPSVFTHKKICTEQTEDSSTSTSSFAHSNLYHRDSPIQFPLPPIGTIRYDVPASLPEARFPDSVEITMNDRSVYEQHLGGVGNGGGNVEACQDTPRHVKEAVSTTASRPSFPVPFRPPFASGSWIEAGARSVDGSWCRSSILGESTGAGLDGFAQAPGLSGGSCNDGGATPVSADSLPPVDCRPLFPPWTRGAGETTWNGGTVPNASGSGQEHPAASSTVSVVPADSSRQEVADFSSAAKSNPIDDNEEVTNAGHLETLPFLDHHISFPDGDPHFTSNHILDSPSTAPAHFSSKFHLTAAAGHPLSVGAPALASAQVPCAQPWLCRIGANDS